MSDGEIQAHLSLIAVDSAYGRRGIARELIESALRVAGGLRMVLRSSIVLFLTFGELVSGSIPTTESKKIQITDTPKPLSANLHIDEIREAVP